jgi:ligand-binding sensor domain-containing protein/two-component sensor histidine kinase
MRSVMTRTGLTALLVLTLRATQASALDPGKTLAEYSLTNWAEDAGPFPFGIYAIAQDRDGYLWLGARTGLVRFDGNEFVLWKGTPPLTDDRIHAICASLDGSLWVGFGTIGGVSRIRDGKVTAFSTRDGLAGGDVNALIEDHDGTMWVGSYGGLSRFQNDRWVQFGANEGLPVAAVIALLRDSRGTLWVGTSVGVYSRGANEHTFRLFAQTTVVRFSEDASGTIWVTDSENGFKILDGPSRHTRIAPPLREGPGRELLFDRSGSLWIGTQGAGLMRVRGLKGEGRLEPVERLAHRDGLISDDIRTLFEDRDGTIWIGSRRGLSRLSESNVKTVRADPEKDTFVYAVTRTRDGNFWTATSEGLKRAASGKQRTFGVEDGLPSHVVTALHEDQSGTLWVATTRGVARSKGGRFVPLPLPKGMGLEQVLSMTSDRGGALWLCDRYRGLFQWKDGHLARMNDLFDEKKVYIAYADSADRVWIGFWNTGIAVYHNNKIVSYSDVQGVPVRGVNLVYEDRRGAIWVGTDHGLGRFDNGRFRVFTRQGFPKSGVFSIVEDAQGFLWFGLGVGLLRISPGEFERATSDEGYQIRYKIYGREDGLPGTLGRPGMPSSARASDGSLSFVTSNGVALVHPDRLHESPMPGPLRIESLVADGRSLDLRSDLSLAAGTARLQIDYSILNLAAAPAPRFRTTLDGFDSGWQELGTRRQTSYTNLPPGQYRFRVVSNTNDGAWNESGAVMAFSIKPAFYQTNVFYGAATLIVVLGVWCAWRLRLRQMNHEFSVVLAERARMGREIHDTLLQSLVGVALEFDDISGQLDPTAESLKKQVARIRERVENYIREARQSIWNLRSPTLERTDLVTALRLFGETATAHNGVRFEFLVTGQPRRVSVKLEEQLLRIGQEALSNAIRHGLAHVIRTELCYDSDTVRLLVSDNGRGFDPDHLEELADEHWGVTTMRERAQQVGARFTLVSSPGAGTRVETSASIFSDR